MSNKTRSMALLDLQGMQRGDDGDSGGNSALSIVACYQKSSLSLLSCV